MSASTQPLVSIVTPAYNGAQYLEECIKSILAQSYSNWEYIIVNNCSTDATREIAERYAQQDARIKVFSNSEVLPIMKNWNFMLRQISKESKYCKVVHADDWLFPQCVELLVGVAEAHPSVGIVGSYCLMGDEVVGDGLPYPSEVIPGRELCRRALREEVYPFLRPSSLLIRSDAIRKRECFYNEPNHYADHEACYEVLREYDFGFVHQVLTFLRTHEKSMTTLVAQPLNTIILNNLLLLTEYGEEYLSPTEYERYKKCTVNRYYQYLALSFFHLREKEFWEYHKSGIRKAIDKFSYGKLIYHCLLEFVLNPTRCSGNLGLSLVRKIFDLKPMS